MRIVQVGLGGFGRDWAKNVIPHVPEVEVVGTADLFAGSRAQAIAAGLTTPEHCYATTQAALEATDPEAVLVTASLVGHVPAARAALASGRHVLIEKPFAPSVAGARELVALADAQGLTVAVSQNYRFFPAVKAVQKIVAEQTYGDLHAVAVDFRQMSGADGVAGPHHALDEPLLVDMSIHHFDLMRMILGQEPVRVFTQVTDPPWSKFRDEASAAITITFERGTVVSYRGSWISTGEPTFWGGDWHVECEHGELRFVSREGGSSGDASDELHVLPLDGTAEAVELDHFAYHGRSAGLLAFANAIETGEEPETSGRRNLPSLALMIAAAKSAESGAVEDIEQFD